MITAVVDQVTSARYNEPCDSVRSTLSSDTHTIAPHRPIDDDDDAIITLIAGCYTCVYWGRPTETTTTHGEEKKYE